MTKNHFGELHLMKEDFEQLELNNSDTHDSNYVAQPFKDFLLSLRRRFDKPKPHRNRRRLRVLWKNVSNYITATTTTTSTSSAFYGETPELSTFL